MIVKNEAPVIRRCLASVRPLIDHWIIADTGSTDGTQTIIRDYLHDIPGDLHERPWVDFAHNRTEALVLARPHGDYTMIIDADDVLEIPPGFRLPFLNADSYTFEIRLRDTRYWRTQLVRNTIAWRYEGVLHEFLSCAGPNGERVFTENRSQKQLKGIGIRMSEEGARRRQSAAERYRRDAQVLETALETETDPFLITRYKFYLAQSYLDAGDKPKALQNYLERSRLGGWAQEVFMSLYRAALIKGELHADDEADVIATFLQAHSVDERRAEALHGAARYSRLRGQYRQGYEFAKRALPIRLPDQGLFLEEWIYQYGVLDEYAVNAYWAGEYGECAKACRKILGLRTIPAELRQRVQANADLAAQHL